MSGQKSAVMLVMIALMTILLPSLSVYSEGGDATEELFSDYTEFYGSVFEEGLCGTEGGNLFTDIVPDFDAKKILSKLNKGEFSVSPKELTEYIIKLLLGEVYSGIKLLAIVLALTVLCSYLSELQSGFGSDTIASCAFYVCYIIIAGVAASAFYEAASCTSQAVENIAYFMRIIVPVMITALMTSGALVSAAALEPTLLSIVEIAIWVIESAFIPAVMISTALNIVNGMSDKFKTDKMVKLLNNTVKWGLSIMLTVFVSLAGLKSIASAGADGLTVKLSKFAASNLIPMVGGILSESVETVLNCSAVIKNSVGVLGIICLCLIALRPILKIGAILILFRICAAIAEPVSDPKIVTCISRLANSISVLFSMLAAVTVMFIMVVTIMINAGNSAVMMGR